MKIVAVTSCITGIAHTYMAAEALEQAARKAGHDIAVETQGSAGSTPLPAATIAAADVVIFATDLEVKGKERFSGKPQVQFGVSKALSEADAVIAAAVAAAGNTPVGAAPVLDTKVPENASTGVRIRQWLMTGVSYMIPFVAAGGILIALSFMIGGYDITSQDQAEFLAKGFNPLAAHDWAYIMFAVGAATFGFLVPVLAGFIAFAIADRPGIAPGFVGGAIAGIVGAGFLGGLLAGFIAGFVALWISRINVPSFLKPMMPVVIIPLFATFITGGLMFTVLGRPLKALMDAGNEWLTGLSGGNMALLGILLGLMMAFDMGGPINKIAYTFAAAGLAEAGATAEPNDPRFVVMAIVMAAGMTPPLGLALATVLRKKLFSDAERQNGKAAWVLGASFITEGAIPFAAADPLRVIPSIMIGSGVTGALVGLFGNTLRAPHGGIWVLTLIGDWWTYLLAIAIGTVVTAFLVILAKGIGKSAVAPAAVEASVV